ncbi:uncharacterized protein BHQ10_010335 [Talaromyces amestolkiae]|uniref:Uncharacterized protein n=1 Tax=Talaromyces amestolkiae TaxID=1196081 RepID=A0A364LEV7_TALAM|nr:uncharacterized protein BHQ10_010335 [Talaromyces amestolkiae]RAO74323.1 hypothetical protein BHQ10_010335 [Talaromyces amestolkiae]
MDPFNITVGALGITGFALSSIDSLRDLIGSLADAEEVVQDIASTLEAIQRPLTTLEQLTISDHAIYAEAKSDLENTGVVEAVNRCGQACADFTRRLQQWIKHSNNSKLSLRDRLSVGLWNREKIRTFRTQIQSCQAIVQFAIESTQLLVQLRSEHTSKIDRDKLDTRLQNLEKAIQEHITLICRQHKDALERQEELQEEPEDEDVNGAQRTLAIREVEEQSRLLESDQTASEVISSQLRAMIQGQHGGNTYSAAFSGGHNSGMQFGYSTGPINWSLNSKYNYLTGKSLFSLLYGHYRAVLMAYMLRRASGDSNWPIPINPIQPQPGFYRPTALVGLGGVGKSQLAIEYAYLTHERSPETWIFWVHASNAARFEQSYREIADTVKLFGRQNPKANIFKLVYDWLRDSKNEKWILILDNFDDAHFLLDRDRGMQDQVTHENSSAGWLLREYLPQSPNGSILITSRSREAALKLVDQRDIIAVEPMDEAHALALLKKKLGDVGNTQDIIELAAALEFIPLAMVQAVAYISDPDRGCSIRQYLDNFQKSDRKKIRLLDYEEDQSRRDWEAENSVLKTWQLSFDSIRQSRRSAADLLYLMSFFDGQGIPEAVLRDHHRQGNTELIKGDDADDSEAQSSMTDEFNDDILILRRYALISINVDRTTFNMHSLVQLATRRWLEVNGELEKWKQQYIQNLSAVFPTGEYENWAQCRVLFPHAKSAAKQRPEGRDSLVEWASVLYKAAWYDLRKGNGAEGEKMSNQAMKARKMVLGLEHEETLNSIEMIALIYLLQGRWKEAEELFVQVTETRKRVLGAEHPGTLASLANLASTYRSQGRWEEAEELSVQVTERRKRVLASTYTSQGRWEEAEELSVQVTETRKRVLGAEHPDTLASLANLASTYMGQGRWEEAEELNIHVIETRKRVLGTEHPDTLASLANLASTHMGQGRWKEAEELNVRVMETRERVLGTEHPDTLASLANLASTHMGQGRWKEAEELNVRVMGTRERVLGTEHPDTLASLANLASTYMGQGRWKEAEELNVHVMETRKRVLGTEHPDTLTSMNNLISIYTNQGRWREANELQAEVTEVSKQVLDSDSSVENGSVFSAPASIPSTRSLESGRGEINLLLIEEFATLLHEDSVLLPLLLVGVSTERIGFERMRNNFRRLLNHFAIDLKADILNELHRDLRSFVSSYSAMITRELFAMTPIDKERSMNSSTSEAQHRTVSERSVQKSRMQDSSQDRELRTFQISDTSNPNDEESDQDSVAEEADDDEPYEGSLDHLDQIKHFILESTAYQTLRRRLEEFVQPTLYSRLRDLVTKWSSQEDKNHGEVARYNLRDLATELRHVNPHEIKFDSLDWRVLGLVAITSLSEAARRIRNKVTVEMYMW